jgi:hypothetical protein
MSPYEYRRQQRTLAHIAREYSPAHVQFDIRLSPGAQLGAAQVGVNLRVDDPQPFLLGYSTLGRAACVRGHRNGRRLGIDTVLAEPVAQPLRHFEYSKESEYVP